MNAVRVPNTERVADAVVLDVRVPELEVVADLD
jgi:hypothetical protein